MIIGRGRRSSRRSRRSRFGMDHPAAAVALALLALYTGGASAGWVDPDTPKEMRRTMSLVDNTEYDLVSTY